MAPGPGRALREAAVREGPELMGGAAGLSALGFHQEYLPAEEATPRSSRGQG